MADRWYPQAQLSAQAADPKPQGRTQGPPSINTEGSTLQPEAGVGVRQGWQVNAFLHLQVSVSSSGRWGHNHLLQNEFEY